MKIKHSFLVSSLLLVTSYASAEVVSLDSIVVSTTSLGTQEKIEDVQASVEVIDKKSIQRSKARSLPQLLNNASGLYIKDAGSTSSLSIRGFNDSHTLILVDGLRRTGKYGSSDLTSIQIEDIERVEIVRGPMSTLYGADALAGVINIITNKKKSADYNKLTLLTGSTQTHQRDTYITKLSGKKTISNITHNYSIEFREKDTYKETKSQVETDLKEESRKFVNYGNSIDLSDSTNLTSKIEYANQNDKGIRSDNTKSYEKENRYQFSTKLNHINDDFIFDSSLGYGYSDTKVNRGSGEETTDYKQIEFNNYFRHFTNDDMTNIIGLGYKHDDIDVSMYSKEASRDNTFILFQNEYTIAENLTSNMGLRYDNFSDFGSTVNPKISILYKNSGFALRGSYGEAFKAPSFTNMYSHFIRSRGPFVYDISGSEDLKPEESKTYEFALSYNKKNLDVELVHHRSKLENLISSYTKNKVGTTSYITYRNIDKSSINGTELNIKYNFNNGFSLNTGIEYLDTKDDSTQERLTGSAKTTIKADLVYSYNKYTTSLNIKKFNKFYGEDENRTNVNSDYMVADLKLNYDYSKKLSLFTGIDNIQNKKMPYNMTSRGTPNDPGERFYYIGMNYNF